MKKSSMPGWAACLAVCSAFTAHANEPGDAPIADALASVSEQVRIYNDHLTILASPWMEGRVPGSRGMELAREYVEVHMMQTGLLPAFPETATGADGSEVITPNATYRQQFPLGGTSKVTAESITTNINGKQSELVAGTDFSVLGLGSNGAAQGGLVFVGYSVNDGPDGYSSFNDDDDLTGKIAVMLRFEPVDDDGSSRWADGNGWSNRASFATKMAAIRDRNPAAVIIVNTPGTNDPRAGQLMGANSAGGRTLDCPVLMMSTEAGDKLVSQADAEGRSLLQLRQLADEGRAIVPLNGSMSLEAKIERESLIAENVAGILPGKGDLADEYIVVGGHLDHLGMGYFGSRSGPGELHPGADDNASGAAGILIFADNMKRTYDALPADADARSIIFMCFDAEESGLNGSRYYTNNPIVPIDDHIFMVNFDMIGRLENKRLSVSGYTTAEGFKEWLQPYFADTPLTVVQNDRINGASDHTPFMQKQVPVLFGICADFHADYHTPSDVSSLINRVGAVETIDLFSNIVTGVATRPERLTWASTDRGDNARQGGQQRGGESGIKVRVGVMPGYNAEGEGVPIEEVTPESSAARAGVVAGDKLIRWDGQKIEDIYAWMDMLGKANPGDKIKIGVLRDGKEVTLDIELDGR